MEQELLLQILNEVKSTKKEINQRFEQMEEKFNQRFEQIDLRFEQMEEKFNQRFEQIDLRFEQMEEKFNQRFEQIDQRFNDVYEYLDDLRQTDNIIVRYLEKNNKKIMEEVRKLELLAN